MDIGKIICMLHALELCHMYYLHHDQRCSSVVRVQGEGKSLDYIKH